MQILHKAKRKDNKEWVVGYYVRYGHTGKEKHYIVPEYASDLYAFEIDETTLCRFTGLKDKNKVYLWEHDIVVINGEDSYFHIVWEEDRACYELESEIQNIVVTFDNYWSHETECYGNFIDNPDLLFEEFEW
jgi:uncharacterized phage protein (TIGR01671 family)